MYYDKTKIIELLKSCANIPIQLNGPYEAPSRTSEGRRCLEVENHQANFMHMIDSLLTRYYRSVFGHIYYDPRNRNCEEVFSELYVEDQNEMSSFVNTKSGYDSFYDYLTSDKDKFLLILSANKGAGKTFFFNYFLSKNDKKLYEQFRIPFVIDFFRIYEDFKSDINCVNNIDFNAYVAVAYLIQTLMYKDEFPVLKVFWETCSVNHFVSAYNNEELLRKYFSEPEACFDYFKEKITSVIIKEESYFIPADPENPNAEMSRRIASTIKLMSDDCIKDTAISFVMALRLFLRERGYSVILFLDGLDNLDYYRDRNIYDMVIKDIKETLFYERNDKRITNFYVLGVRSETYSKLKVQHKYYSKGRFRFNISGVDINDLLLTKKRVAMKPRSKIFRNSRKDCLVKVRKYRDRIYKEIIDESEIDRNNQNEECINVTTLKCEISHKKNRSYSFEKQFSDLVNNFINRITKSIKEVYKSDERYQIDEIDANYYDGAYRRFVLEVLYNGNLRALLHNIININKNISLKPQAVMRPYLYREGQLLNGLLYLNTEEEPFFFGQVIYNLFFFDNAIKIKKWNGLCSIRILQSLNVATDESDLRKVMVSLFEYDEDAVEYALSMLTQHGLVSCEKEQNGVKFERTLKGTFVLNYVFVDPSVFYFLALDTPLNCDITAGGEKVHVHSNRANERKFFVNFMPSMVPTNITMIRHILTTNKAELKGFSEKDIRKYELPAHFPGVILDQIAHRLESMLRRGGVSTRTAKNIINAINEKVSENKR